MSKLAHSTDAGMTAADVRRAYENGDVDIVAAELERLQAVVGEAEKARVKLREDVCDAIRSAPNPPEGLLGKGYCAGHAFARQTALRVIRVMFDRSTPDSSHG